MRRVSIGGRWSVITIADRPTFTMSQTGPSIKATSVDMVQSMIRPSRSIVLPPVPATSPMISHDSMQTLLANDVCSSPVLKDDSQYEPRHRSSISIICARQFTKTNLLKRRKVTNRSLASFFESLGRSVFVRRMRRLRSHKVLDMLGSRPFIHTRGDSSKSRCDAHLPIRPRRHCRLPHDVCGRRRLLSAGDGFCKHRAQGCGRDEHR